MSDNHYIEGNDSSDGCPCKCRLSTRFHDSMWHELKIRSWYTVASKGRAQLTAVAGTQRTPPFI